MIRLYHCVSARSFRPLWAIEELGLPFPQTLVLRYSRFEPEHRRLPGVADVFFGLRARRRALTPRGRAPV